VTYGLRINAAFQQIEDALRCVVDRKQDTIPSSPLRNKKANPTNEQ
jgi:hypothetical protein